MSLGSVARWRKPHLQLCPGRGALKPPERAVTGTDVTASCASLEEGTQAESTQHSSGVAKWGCRLGLEGARWARWRGPGPLPLNSSCLTQVTVGPGGAIWRIPCGTCLDPWVPACPRSLVAERGGWIPRPSWSPGVLRVRTGQQHSCGALRVAPGEVAQQALRGWAWARQEEGAAGGVPGRTGPPRWGLGQPSRLWGWGRGTCGS